MKLVLLLLISGLLLTGCDYETWRKQKEDNDRIAQPAINCLFGIGENCTQG
jgi:hypothetical protein